MLTRLANPARFQRLSKWLLPWLTLATVLCIGAGLYFALFVSPADYQQGEMVRVMYIHVPAAWMALFTYATMAVASGVGLVWKHPLAHVAALAAAPIGAAFTVICLGTGMLWGKPMWGAWWVWDARLTSVVVLLFIYLGFIALANAFDDPARGEKAAAILALVGAVNLPIIKFSVDWWNTLHQPASITRIGPSAIHPEMMKPLLLMAVGFTLLFAVLLLIRMRSELVQRRLRVLRINHTRGSAPERRAPAAAAGQP